MEENKKIETVDNVDVVVQNEEENSFDIRTIFTMVILNWQWFVLSLLIFIFGALIYLRYTTPVYQVSVKMLIKDEDTRRRSSSQLANMRDFGFMTNSTGIENEVEILQSKKKALGVSAQLIRSQINTIDSICQRKDGVSPAEQETVQRQVLRGIEIMKDPAQQQETDEPDSIPALTVRPHHPRSFPFMELVLFSFSIVTGFRVLANRSLRKEKRSRGCGIFMERMVYAFFSGTQMYTFMSPEPSSGGR